MPLSPQLFKGIITWNMTCHITAWIDWRVYLRLMWNKNFWHAMMWNVFRNRWCASTVPGLLDPPKCLALCPSTARDAPVTIQKHYSCMMRLCKAQFHQSWPITNTWSSSFDLSSFFSRSAVLPRPSPLVYPYWHTDILIYWWTGILI